MREHGLLIFVSDLPCGVPTVSLEPEEPITELLHAAASGDDAAFEEVSSRTYRELEALANSKLRRQYGVEFAGATWSPAPSSTRPS